MICKLSEICDRVREKVDVSSLSEDSYISTENMLPNRGGITQSTCLPPTGRVTAFRKGDVLVSNIRPYFKKIWHAKYHGGCSNDVLVFRAREGICPRFLFYLLVDDAFFAYSMATSKGTRMPRGDISAIMEYEARIFPFSTQEKIASILGALDDKIELNLAINRNLEEQAKAIYKNWFIDFNAQGGTAPVDWRMYRLSEFLPVKTGKKNANIASNQGKYPFFSCARDYTWVNDYSYDGNAILVAGNGNFNVKFYNGKFDAYQRTYVLIPYEPKYAAWLFYAIQFRLGEITLGQRGSVIRFITKGDLENFEVMAPKDLSTSPMVDTLDTINRTIASNNEENLKLAALRDTLLPRLMRGCV